jgi:hypothetical protein
MARSSNPTDPTLPEDDVPLEGEERPPEASESGEVAFDSRTKADRREGQDRRKQTDPVKKERRSGGERRDGAERRTIRKRNINQYDLSPEAQELAEALGRFRRDHDNRFPTVAQILGVVRELGYEKHDDDQ